MEAYPGVGVTEGRRRAVLGAARRRQRLTSGPPLTRTSAKSRRTRTEASPSSRSVVSRSCDAAAQLLELVAQARG